MNKLTAEKCRERIKKFKRLKKQFGIAMETELSLQAFEIALPILEQQERGEGEWIKCSERMPAQGQEVLALYEGGHMNVLFISRAGDMWDDGDYHSSISLSRITHWQPLPSPPEDV